MLIQHRPQLCPPQRCHYYYYYHHMQSLSSRSGISSSSSCKSSSSSSCDSSSSSRNTTGSSSGSSSTFRFFSFITASVYFFHSLLLVVPISARTVVFSPVSPPYYTSIPATTRFFLLSPLISLSSIRCIENSAAGVSSKTAGPTKQTISAYEVAPIARLVYAAHTRQRMSAYVCAAAAPAKRPHTTTRPRPPPLATTLCSTKTQFLPRGTTPATTAATRAATATPAATATTTAATVKTLANNARGSSSSSRSAPQSSFLFLSKAATAPAATRAAATGATATTTATTVAAASARTAKTLHVGIKAATSISAAFVVARYRHYHFDVHRTTTTTATPGALFGSAARSLPTSEKEEGKAFCYSCHERKHCHVLLQTIKKRSFLPSSLVSSSFRPFFLGPPCLRHFHIDRNCCEKRYSNNTMTGKCADVNAAAAAVCATNKGGEPAPPLSDEELRRENAAFKALDALGLNYKVYRHREVMTVAELLKEPVLQGEGNVVGNLFLKDKKKGFFLVTILHDSPTPMKGLGKLLQATNLRLAPSDALTALLDVQPGAVTPLALINDTRKEVQMVMDTRIRQLPSDARILVHPLHNKATLSLTVGDLIKYIEAHNGGGSGGGGHTIQWIDCQEAARIAGGGGGEMSGSETPEGAVTKEEHSQTAVAKTKMSTAKGKGAGGGRVLGGGVGEQQQPNGGGATAAGAGAGAGAAADGCMLGITVRKSENFPEWYTQVILRSEMIEYYDVSGCYIMRPWSYFIWETVQRFFDTSIKATGVQNAYFPMFVSQHKLEREKEHIEGFSPEVAWVTHYGDTPLAEKLAIRPTSETIMYSAFSKWIRSHRDLPLKLNQWCSVVRWEFKQPTPFLRSREFLWQEGHTVHATEDEAMAVVLDILELYRRWYEEWLAVPVIKGEKSENEKFPGGVKTTTCESFIPENGRGIQAATSHFLGTNFAKMFEIQFEDEDGKKQLAHQTSWGCTTRSLGVMTMVHGDDKGLVLPPRVAPVQVIIIPIFFKDALTKEILAQCTLIDTALKKADIRSKIDDRANYTPGWKFNNWEVKGVPLRLEVGPRDVAKKSMRVVRRDSGAATELPCDEEALAGEIETLLQQIQKQLFETAQQRMQDGIERISRFSEVMPALNRKHLVLAPWCEDPATEDDIKRETQRLSELQTAAAAGAEVAEVGDDDSNTLQQRQQQSLMTGAMKCLCIPFEQPPLPEGTKCFFTGKPAKRWSLWGRSY